MRKNPLNNRFVRDLRDDLGKYVVIALLMIFTIGFISGFLVADGSMIKAYNESFTKYNVEDGNFRTQRKMNKAQWKSVEKLGLILYEIFYREFPLENGSTIRVFKNREQVNLVCLMEGELPAKPGEIAVDRMYADNNGLKVGDRIRPASDGAAASKDSSGEVTESKDTAGSAAPQDGWVITGLVALSDYSTMFSDNNDTMFDALKFGVAVCSPEEFGQYPEKTLYFDYAWKYVDPPGSEEEENDRGEDLMKSLSKEVKLESYIPRYANQAIRFTGEDMGSDRAMMQLLLYIMIGIIAFVFGITISNTISKEAPVIGTLRAMGFTKSELVRHYMAMPLLVTLVSAVIGNILGYTALKNVCADMYYNSYSLPKYVTIWNADAFVQTTAVPILIMALITWGVLRWSLGLTPLQFLRRDLRRRKSRKAFPLSPGIPFMDRFRIRVIAQNIPNYLILLFGIFFANILLIFGLALPVALDHYKQVIAENLLAEHQYILQIPLEAVDEDHKLRGALKMMEFARGVETENETAEKFSAYNLRTPADGPYHSEDVMIYGMKSDSLYVKGIPESDPGAAEAAKTAASTAGSSGTAANTSKSTAAGAQSTADAAGAFPKVLISSAYSDKYDVFPGDRIVLQEKYGEDRYTFEVAGVYDYQASICVFMEQKTMNQCFDLGKDYFSGYMSQTPITDIDDKYIASEIDFESLTKVCRQLTISMGSMMYLVDFFAVVIFLVLIYILSKIIIEKNAQSISMAKILGYTGGEIGQLYIRSTTVVYLISFAATIPGVSKLIRYLMKVMIRMEMTGWIDLYVRWPVYVEMIILGVLSYAVVALFEYRKIGKVPMDEALKNVE